jgi:hypothetical protein
MRTTYHDFDGWPRPQRAPQHAAAPFGPSSAARLKAQRALRLFATAGLWAAGLCLVIGAIVLVVAQAKPGRLTPASVRTSMRAGRLQLPSARPVASRSARTARRTRGAPRPRQLAAFSGHGDKTTGSFRTAAGAGWQIQWSYACARAVRAGLFVVEDARTGAAGASITQSGVAGHGATSLRPAGRTHHLIVISNCSWTMKVTQHR